MKTIGECSYIKVSTSIENCLMNSWDLSYYYCYVRKRKFVYVFSSRSFSSKHRSEKIVVTEFGKQTKYHSFFEYLAFPNPARQVSQTEYLHAMKL